MRRRKLHRRYGRALRTNSEGMRLSEWVNAANAFGRVIEGAAAHFAWDNGEDPTEYAALASRGLKVKLVSGKLIAGKW